jgi:hypothetical protein
MLSNTHTALTGVLVVNQEAECLQCSLLSLRQLFYLEQKVTLDIVKFLAKFLTVLSEHHPHQLESGSTSPLR